MITIYTVGHGTRSIDELIAVLAAPGVSRLIDVRRWPVSRRHPQFTKDAVAKSLGDVGIAYEWCGEELGGRRRPVPGPSRHSAWRNASFRAYADYMDTKEFADALDRLVEEAGQGPPLAIMCAETLWWRCHRRLIADALSLRGCDVVHLIRPGEREPHKPHPSLKSDDAGRPLYA